MSALRIVDARIEGRRLVLDIDSVAEAFKWLKGFKKDSEYEITRKTFKRSTDANSYAWLLINRIAEVLKKNPVDVYREQIKNISGRTQQCAIPKEAYIQFVDSFVENHIGRSVHVLGECRDVPGYIWVLVTYGSSDYDTRKMSELINGLIEDCRALDIETREQGYIDSLLEAW